MNTDSRTVVFLGNGRCYHTLDWFRSAQRLSPATPPVFVTDLIEGESFHRLLRAEDIVHPLYVIDGMLPRRQSRAGDIWRNIVKLGALPLQALRLRKVLRRYRGHALVHAHSMYYIALARLAACPYVATPQGSEVLVRPQRSLAYRMFARLALRNASQITVDSSAMQDSVANLLGRTAWVIQNGIDMGAIAEVQASGTTHERAHVVSLRGYTANYRIDELLRARDATCPDLAIHFCYPFADETYKSSCAAQTHEADCDVGRLPRSELYELLSSARLAISIPKSDSSPRSVYEAIFCGCLVATTPASWIDALPQCMRNRLIIVDLKKPDWLAAALATAKTRQHESYIPSPQAMEQFDQLSSMRNFYRSVYPTVGE